MPLVKLEKGSPFIPIEQIEAQPVAQPSDDWAITRGFKNSVGQAPKLIGAAIEGIGAAIPGEFVDPYTESISQGLANYSDSLVSGMEPLQVPSYQNIVPENATMSDAPQVVSRGLTYAGEAIGQGMGSFVPQVASMAAGGVVGAGAGLVTAGPAGAVAGGVTGMAVGRGASSFGQSYGEIFQALKEEAPKFNEKYPDRVISLEELGQAALIPGAGAGALDYISFGRLMPVAKDFASFAGLSPKEAAKKLLKSAFEGGLTEGSTEAAQQGIQVGTSSSTFGRPVTAEEKASIIDSAIMGGLSGGVMKAGGEVPAAISGMRSGAIQKPPVSQETPDENALNKDIVEPPPAPTAPPALNRGDLERMMSEPQGQATTEKSSDVPRETVKQPITGTPEIGDTIEHIDPNGQSIKGRVDSIQEGDDGQTTLIVTDSEGNQNIVFGGEGETLVTGKRPLNRDDLLSEIKREQPKQAIAPVEQIDAQPLAEPEAMPQEQPVTVQKTQKPDTIESLQAKIDYIHAQAKLNGWNEMLKRRELEAQSNLSSFKKRQIDEAAAQANPEPTEAQKESGNYKKGHIKISGLDIAIENAKGSVRSGVDSDGESWQTEMPAHYGYIKRTEGADGDAVDVYIGDNPDAQEVFFVDQIDPKTGRFDEAKVMIGFNSSREAGDAYKAAFSDGSGVSRVGAVHGMTVAEFKDWLKNGDTKKPLVYQEPVPSPVPVAEPVAKKQERKPKAIVEPPKSAEPQKGEVGMMLSSGQVVTTATGRQTTPFPKFSTDTPRKTSHAVKNVENWLMQNALAEAQARGDEFNALQFQANMKKPSQADKDSAEYYLFGDTQPAVQKSIFREEKPVVTSKSETTTEPVGAENALTETKAQEKPDEDVVSTVERQVFNLIPDDDNRTPEIQKLVDGRNKLRKIVNSVSDEEYQYLQNTLSSEYGSNFPQDAAMSNEPEKSLEAWNRVLNDYREGKSKPAQETAPANETAENQPSEPENVPETPVSGPQDQENESAKPSVNVKVADKTPSPKTKESISDFGEKIEGAKKDLWKDYAKSIGDELPDDLKDITLSKHFPEPNYEVMIANGVTTDVLAAIKAMRDIIPSKPQKSWKLKEWASKVKTVRELSKMMLDGKLSLAQIKEKMGEYSRSLSGLAQTMELYSTLGYPAFTKAKGWSVSESRISKRIDGEIKDIGNRWVAASGEEFGKDFDTKEQAIDYIRSKIAVEDTTKGKKQTTFEVYRITKTGEIVIGKKIAAGKFINLKGGFKTGNEARLYMAENGDELIALYEKKKDVPPERRSVNDPRRGEDYRNGEDVSVETLAKTFGFRGIQFGNYVEQKRRAEDINNAYDAMKDMAAILGVPENALSLEGTLGLAFGARGGGSFAAAHYERGQTVINLTKKSGAGSLAHEWFHAFDHNFGKRRDGKDVYITESAYLPTKEVRKEVTDAFADIVKAIRQTGLVSRSEAIDKTRSKDYWSTVIEMAARSFEAYIIYKAEQKGGSNDYLANVVGEDAWKASRGESETDSTYPYPTEKEMSDKIAPAFDKLFDVLETKDTDKGIVMFSLSSSDKAENIRASIEKNVKRRTKQIGIPVENLRLFDDIRDIRIDGVELSNVGGVEGFYLDDLIYISMVHKDPVKAVTHESVHALKAVGAFMKSEWKMLEEASAKWMKKYDIEKTYRDLYREKLIEANNKRKEPLPMADVEERLEAMLKEEAIAHAMQDYEVKGFMNRIRNKIQKFLRMLGSVLLDKQFEFKTPEQVFKAILGGELAKRVNVKERLATIKETKKKFDYYEQPFYSRRQVANGLQSTLVKAVGKLKQLKGTGQQMLGILKNMDGVKEEEIAWTGLDDFLANKPTVSKQEIVDYLDQNHVKIDEVTLGEDYGDVESWWNDEGGANEETPFSELSQKEKNSAMQRYRDEVGEYNENGTNTKFSQYTLPNGENYREVLLTLPPAGEKTFQFVVKEGGGRAFRFNGVDYETEQEARDAEKNARSTEYKSNHFEQPNILAHVRLNDRTDADGKKVLFVEEIQSDWAQTGRKRGFKGQVNPYPADYIESYRQEMKEKQKFADKDLSDQEVIDYFGLKPKDSDAVPSMPMSKSWHEMAFRRIVQMAAQQGYDSVAWTTGEQQNDRYDLSKTVDSISYSHNNGNLVAMKDGKVAIKEDKVPKDKLDDYVGKDVAQRLIDTKPEDDGFVTLEGNDLKVGGSGMKGFYDNIIVKYANKFGKKFGASVTKTEIDTGKTKKTKPDWTTADNSTVPDVEGVVSVHSMDITPSMREAADEGFAMFSILGRKDGKKMTKEEKLRQAIDTLDAAGLADKLRPSISKIASYILHPHQIASLYESFTPVYLGAIEMMKMRDVLVHKLSKNVHLYNKMNKKSKAKIDAVLEIGRLSKTNFKPNENGLIVVKNEGFKDTVWSKDGDEITLSDVEVSAYEGVRAAMDLSLDVQIQTTLEEYGFADMGIKTKKDLIAALAKEGAKELKSPSTIKQMQDALKIIRDIEDKKRNGYIPFKRWGEIGIVVRTKGEDAELTHFERVEIPRNALFGRKQVVGENKAVIEAVKRLREKYPSKDFNIHPFEMKDFSKLKADINLTDLDVLKASSEMTEDEWDSLRGMLSEAMQKRGYKQHFLQSNDVSGYSGDFERAINDYIVSVSGHLARRVHTPKLDAAVSQIEKKGEASLFEYARKYVSYITDPVEEFAAVRQMAYFWYLAGNLASGVTNSTQPLMVTAPWFKAMFSHGQIAKQMSKAYKDSVGLMTLNNGTDIFDFSKAPDDVRDALIRADAEGDFLPKNTHDAMAIADSNSSYMRGAGRRWRQVMDITSLTFSVPERANRVVTYISAYRFAIQPENKKKIMAFIARDQLGRAMVAGKNGAEFAEAFSHYAVMSTQLRMGKLNRPTLSRGVGTLPFQFMSFSLQMLELMHRLSKVHGGKSASSVGMMLFAVVAMAGVKGIPFEDDLQKLFESAYKTMTRTDIDIDSEMLKLLTKYVGKTAAQAIVKGAPYALANLDMSTRLGYGNLVPDNQSDLFGVWFDMFWTKPVQATKDLARGEVGQAFADVAPAFIRNPIQAYLWSEEGVKSASTGDTIIPPEDVTKTDIGLKMLGFTSSSISGERNRIYAEKRASAAANELRSDYYDRLARAYAGMVRASKNKDNELKSRYESEIEAITIEKNTYNQTAPLYKQIIINNKTLKQRINEELEGAKSNKPRKQARQEAEELKKVWGN